MDASIHGDRGVGDPRETRRRVVVIGAWAHPCVALRAVGEGHPEILGLPRDGLDAGENG